MSHLSNPWSRIRATSQTDTSQKWYRELGSMQLGSMKQAKKESRSLERLSKSQGVHPAYD